MTEETMLFLEKKENICLYPTSDEGGRFWVAEAHDKRGRLVRCWGIDKEEAIKAVLMKIRENNRKRNYWE